MTTFLQDLRYGARMLRRSPGFAAVAIATLSLGIGANTAIFSVVNALLLRPLPYGEPSRLVMVWQDMRARGGPETEWATPGNFVDWKKGGPFVSAAAIQGWLPALLGASPAEVAEPLVGEQVTYEYFDVLGVRPALGRSFRAEEDVPNAPRVVVLSHALWQRRFNGDSGAIGRSIVLSGEPHEVVGVMPPGFRPAVARAAELWRPRRLNLANPSRGAVVLRVVARLKPELTFARAESAAAVLAAQLTEAHPDSNTGAGINLMKMHEYVVGNIDEGLLMLLGAVSFVLLIACANIANLLLARAAGRSREIAVRLALGAQRPRVVRQLLTESLLLSLTGGTLGVLLSIWGVSALVAIAPGGSPRLEEIGIDSTVLVFALALSMVTGVLFGLAPALHAARASVTPALKDGTRGGTGVPAHRTRRVLIVLEVGIALVLLVGSGLLMRTLLKLQGSDLGFDADRVLLGTVLPPGAVYTQREQRIAFYDRLLARVSAIPGVETAALSSIVPLAGGDSDMDILIEGRSVPRNSAEATAAWYRLVSAGYHRAIGIPIKQGRHFEPGEAAPVVIVSEMSARRFWGSENPIGKRVRFSDAADAPWFTVVGVAGDVRLLGARSTGRAEVYLPYWQFPELGTNVVLKTTGRPEVVAGALRDALRDVDPNVPVSNISSMAALVGRSIDQPRFFALLVGVFAALALLLAAIGIYGVIAYAVAQRTGEIGVRMALGAARRDVFALVVADGLKLTAAGVALGLAVAAGVSLSLRSLLFGVEPLDPVTYAGVTATLALAALLACVLPAYRAARVDPMTALRTE
jgi:putative ABC transport system permease protein